MILHPYRRSNEIMNIASRGSAAFWYLLALLTLMSVISLATPRASKAACAKVKLEILQELTLERIAFDAKMGIENNVPDKDITNVRVDVTIQDSDGKAKNDIFFVRVTSIQNITGVDGTGQVRAATTGEIHWLIIPSPGAGGTDPAGKAYFVGATLTYTIAGKEEVVTVVPDRIIVKPEPQLILDYFTPYDVLGDNPFTPQVEAPIPYPLAVRVLNAGYGPAVNLKIESAQPKIVENLHGLLVDFKLLGSTVNDSAVSPSLTVPIGTLDSMKISTASWEMISTLSGRITEFKATFSHASELGGELTSLLKETNTNYLTHRVKVNLPGRDNRLDFLAYSTDLSKNPDRLPDSIFESEIPGNNGKTGDARSPVSVVQVVTPPARPTPSAPEVLVSLQTGTAGWVYARLSDPAQGLLKLLDVVRTDGVHLDPNNFWVQEGLDTNYKQIFTLNILDYRADASAPGTYTLVYTQPAEDTIPPSTRLIFDGPASGADPLYYITPATRIVLLATDNDGGSGVNQMFRKVTGTDADFIAAYPFNLDVAGTYTLEYFSVDRAGNAEAAKTATIVVDDNAPTVLTFQASPSTISPYAPRGIAAARTMDFAVKATDAQSALQATIDIVKGGTYSPTAVVRTFKTALTKDVESKLTWDGKDSVGSLVPTGAYTARLSVTDGLDSSPTTSHTATATIPITVADWFAGQPLDQNVAGDQQHPRISGTRAVWQDNRSGSWQIYTKDTSDTSTGTALAVTANGSDHQYPAVDGTVIVWQDNRNGNWDIYGYNVTSGQEFVICNDAGSQERPVIAGNWVAWQDDRNGNWDIYTYNLLTHVQTRITDHVRDQLHPAMAGTKLTWEDYRHGLGEIYSYDLTSGTETRYTVDIYNQTLPAVSGTSLVWTDQRNDQRDIYYSPSQNNEIRVTYGAGDHSQATMLDDVIVYTDYEAGIGDPNLSFYDTRSGTGALLTANPARQEEPALGTGVLVWQDDRDGISQIYWSLFQVEAVPITLEIKPGLNLIAVGDKLATAYPTSSALMAASPNGLVIEKVVAYGSQSGIFMDTSDGADIALRKGMAIGLYAEGSGTLEVAESGEAGLYTLLPGANYVGMLTMPNGYTAYSMIESIGLENIQSVRRFNNQTGLWETAAVRDASGALSAAGVNFVLHQGDGVIVVMKKRVDGWKP